MGVAWATKWIGLYASAGLALLFFWSMARRWREYRAAMRDGRAEWAYAAAYPRYIGITILFCLVFFVAIPMPDLLFLVLLASARRRARLVCRYVLDVLMSER